MDTTLSIKVPGTVVPYVKYLASKKSIDLRVGLVEAITINSWCLLCVETVGADTSWSVLGNTL